MNSPAPFAVVMMAGLLLLFSSQETLRIPAAVAGYLAFLLSLVRSAWGGWFVGLLTILTSLKPRLQMRLIVTILMMAVCVFPLTTVPQFSENINSRFETISNLKEDHSFNARAAHYEADLDLALSNGLGNGIGGVYFINNKGLLEKVVLDSAILDIFFTLGWFGAIPYLSGMILLLFNLFQGSQGRFDSFASAARAIVLGILAQLVFSSVMLGLSGMVFWGFLGMGVAARKYYQHQCLDSKKVDALGSGKKHSYL
jgi:hypothetical protein